MNKVKVYVLEIEFPLAFFKIPYTVKTRNTYLIPRKKAIISIFNAFFEKPISLWKIRKNKLIEEEKIVEDFLVGAELITFEKTIETQRIVQIKGNSAERPPSSTELIVNAKYVFYLPQEENNLKINFHPINYYPFAGQNDYLAYMWKLEVKDAIIKEGDKLNSINYQLIQNDLIDITNSKASLILENALEKFVIAKGELKLNKKVKILEIDNREILLF